MNYLRINLHHLLAVIWNHFQGKFQWHILWLLHDKFMIGVAGVVLDDAGRVLLLRHRYRRAAMAWGLPSGYANKGERLEETLGRELQEETGLRADVIELLQINSGFQLRFEVYFLARLTGGELQVDGTEVLEADFFAPDNLPDGLPQWHRAMIEQVFQTTSPPTV